MNSVEIPPFSAAGPRGREYLASFVCAVAGVFLIRSGLLAVFFLVPFGFVAAAYSIQTARRTLAATLGLNLLTALGFYVFLKTPLFTLLLDVLYYSVLFLLFFWIMAPPSRGPAALRPRTAWRLVVSAVAGGLIFLFIESTIFNTSEAPSLFRSRAELLSSLFISSAGADAARRSYAELHLTPERIMEFLRLAALRGGAAASSLLLFFVNRQLAWFLAWIIRRIRPLGPAAGSLRGFYAPRHTIWALSFSLAAVLSFRIAGLSAVETLAWNILTLCVMLFLAQGGGIMLYILSRRAMSPLMRLFLNILIIMLIFSPGINAVALGVLVLLGIAENWVPFRAPKPDGSSSTPGM
ncbi:MAG: YybS family protein [Treponema sp.]|jgi:hypothetical protein|nr:YybS family protein [Treponema sp.]